MAATSSQAFPLSPSLSSSRCRYQVFLSFRGEDTRKNFISHLYKAMVQAGIHTFRDDDEIRRGENIELELQKAIQQSKIAVVVFSEDYASSRWCLDELAMIMERRRTAGWKVLPVFYHVDPSDVRKQTGSFGRAFVKHEKRPYVYEEIKRVNGWRLALEEVANLAGMVLGEGLEAAFVNSIVKEVTKELNPTKFHVQYFIGRDSLLKDINSWLQSGSYGGEIAMLYGIGGVGKTTIAKIVCNQNFDKFESISFIGNIGQKSKQSNGLLSLQRQLLCDVLNENASEIHDEDQGIMKIKDAICCKKILLVLDDVDDKDQFNVLIRMREWLYPGSKIIVTTRVKGLFAVHEDCVKFKVEPLEEKESIELFSWHAFGQAHPVEELVEHSKSVVSNCKGLPLALGAIGSSLSSTRVKEVWESALEEMKKIPNSKVQEVLKISYKSLHDDHQKNLFLDVACFFIGTHVDSLFLILNGLGVGGKWRINNLIDRCLIEIDEHKRISMHQLIRDMGREIACEESSKYQRIWHHMEAFTMLENNTDTERVRGLILDMHELIVHHKCSFIGRYCPPSGFFSWKRLSNIFFEDGQTSLFPLLGTNAFKKMQNIKFLQLNYVKFDGGYEHFPKSLLSLCWHGFSLTSIPKTFCLEKLVVLDMRYSNLVDVWKGKMSLPELKILDLSHSHSLLRTPDLKGLECLETLILEDCINLVEIHESIGGLHRLAVLNLRGCTSLEELPEEISKLNSLGELVLAGCSNLDGINIKLFQQLRRRWSLHRDGVVPSTSHMIRVMPWTLVSHFWPAKTKRWRLSTSILPCSLVKLDLSGTPICQLPENVKGLTSLHELWLTNCKMLQTIPELPISVAIMGLKNCHSLEKVAHLVPSMFLSSHIPLQVQDWIKQELIEVADIHVFRLMEIVCRKQLRSFQVLLTDNVFSFCIYGHHYSGIFEAKLPNEVRLSLYGRKLHVLRLCTALRFVATFNHKSRLFVEIKNNAKGGRKGTLSCDLSSLTRLRPKENAEIMWFCDWKFGDGGLEFEDGDDLSVCVSSNDPAIQLATTSVKTICEEMGNEKKESNSSVPNQILGDEYVSEKQQIASSIFGKYFCIDRQSLVGLRRYKYVFCSNEETDDERPMFFAQVRKPMMNVLD